jgi:DMSO reductase family type II enzyme chaperone
MPSDHEVCIPLARAVIYEALAEGFAPPTESALRRLVSGDGAATIAKEASIIDAAKGGAIAQALRRLPSAISLAELRDRNATLFGHTARGEVPPYETEYGEDDIFRQPNELADIAGFFRAFGMPADRADRGRCDHVGIECEFMSWLCLKEAYAAEHADGEMLAEVRKARRLFLRDHLGRFAPAFGRMLSRADKGGFYGTMGEVVEKFVVAECKRESVPAGPRFLRLRDPSEAEVPMACGESCEAAAHGCAAPVGVEGK